MRSRLASLSFAGRENIQVGVRWSMVTLAALPAIEGVIASDPTIRTGVISMTHGFGTLPEDTVYERDGSNTGMLISTDRDLEPINAMPRMTAIPVTIARCA